MLTLFAAVTVLLLVACGNVAGLTLVRASTRSHEFAVRPTVISKFLMLGMPLDQAIGCVTAHAAANVSAFKGLGTLAPGGPADVAVLELRDGDFEFVDNVDATRTGHRKLVTTAVVMNGKLEART